MNLAIVTDEISLDLDAAVREGMALGIKAFELRSLHSPTLGRAIRCSELPAADLPCVRAILERQGARLMGLSPGLFKVRLSDPVFAVHRRELLYRSLDLAQALGLSQMVIFSPVREEGALPGPCPSAGLAALAEAAREAGARGVTLLLENEPICYADTGVRTAELLRRLSAPALRANWDPGNALAAGEAPYPEGYLALRPFVHEVHVKDARRLPGDRTEWARLGEGEIDWPQQLRALAEDGFRGYITVETHLEPRLEATRANVNALRGMIGLLNREYGCA